MTTKRVKKSSKKSTARRWGLPKGWAKMEQPERVRVALKRDPSIVVKLRKEAAFIATYPHQYNQKYWGLVLEKTANTPCGTACCIAGGYALQSGCTMKRRHPLGYASNDADFFRRGKKIGSAAELLIADLNRAFSGQSKTDYMLTDDHSYDLPLFAPEPEGYWGAPFDSMWRKAGTAEEFVHIAVARIEHFIRTGE